MKSYFLNKFKFIALIIFIITSLTFLGIKNFILSGGCSNLCSFGLKNGILDPIYNYSGIVSLIFLSSLFLPIKYLRFWFLYILSWTLPLSFFVIVSESPYATGGVLGMSGRPFFATFTAYTVTAISLVTFIILGLIDLLKYLKNRK